jgi:hypothetical protein
MARCASKAAGARKTTRRRKLDWTPVGKEVEPRACDHRGCPAAGEFRAPVAPEAEGDYYWFCLDHVREYNKAWNFCAGRSDAEIEAMIRADMVGGRPTWPLGRLGGRSARARFGHFKDSFGLFADEAAAEEAVRAAARERARRKRKAANPAAEKEREALDLMDLTPPVTEDRLKARYKELVKRHHPDANGGDKEAEERLKLINQAYSTLKQCLYTE